jgi:phenylpropionate dioxygenase-like ring-hydroxylating dioxygenase large terminal subunit
LRPEAAPIRTTFVLINLWYVAEWSHAVKDKPVKARLLGQNFVLFRDAAGKVQCLSDVCLHRGGALSGGKVHDDCVACPYHGWRYNGKGEVTFIPSRGAAGPIPQRAMIDAYPTEERYGMIWVFLGDLPEAERYPIPPFPEYGQPGWRELTGEFTWKASAARVVENGIDMAHASFVHPVFGHPSTADKNYIESEQREEWWATHTCVMHPPQFKGIVRQFIRKERQPTRVHPTYYLPGYSVRLQVDLRPGWSTIVFDANTPVDEFTTRTFAIQLRSFFRAPIFDRDSKRRLMEIFHQDAAIVENSQPNWLPETLENELSVQHDRFMSGWRATRRRHVEEKGWQIDSAALRPYEGFKTFAIPSPQRRERPDLKWVIDPVPLKPATRRPRSGESSADAGALRSSTAAAPGSAGTEAVGPLA